MPGDDGKSARVTRPFRSVTSRVPRSTSVLTVTQTTPNVGAALASPVFTATAAWARRRDPSHESTWGWYTVTWSLPLVDLARPVLVDHGLRGRAGRGAPGTDPPALGAAAPGPAAPGRAGRSGPGGSRSDTSAARRMIAAEAGQRLHASLRHAAARGIAVFVGVIARLQSRARAGGPQRAARPEDQQMPSLAYLAIAARAAAIFSTKQTSPLKLAPFFPRGDLDGGRGRLLQLLLDEYEAPELVLEPVEVLLRAFLGAVVRPARALEWVEAQVDQVGNVGLGLPRRASRRAGR